MNSDYEKLIEANRAAAALFYEKKSKEELFGIIWTIWREAKLGWSNELPAKVRDLLELGCEKQE